MSPPRKLEHYVGVLVLLIASGAFYGAPHAHRPAVIGYLFARGAVVDPSKIAAAQLTHLNYAFANIRNGQVVEGSPHDAENLKTLTALRRAHPQLKILVSVGGWTWSGGFSGAASTAESRKRFVASAVSFVRRHDLDGLDVDWEYPGLPGFGNPHTPEDGQHFTRLMADLRRALDAEGARRGRRAVLTFAAGAFPDFIAHTELARVQRSVDYVNLMTYDFREADVDSVTGHHANLCDTPADDKHVSVDRAVRQFLAAGVPRTKLVVGIPFYGRAWGNVEGRANGLYQHGHPLASPMDLSYGHLASDVVGRDGFVRFWDPQAHAPYLWNAARRVFVSYDDPESLRLKARYVRAHGLGGVMFWEYNDDGSGALLHALSSTLTAASDHRAGPVCPPLRP
jgi:chitinase